MPTMKKRMKAQYLAREEEKEREEPPAPEEEKEENVIHVAKKLDKTEKAKASIPTKAKKHAPHWLKDMREEDILVSKRARHVPETVARPGEWLNSNFEKRAVEEGFLNKLTFSLLYDLYTEECQQTGSLVPQFTAFRQSVVKLYGKDIGLKADSKYKGQVTERKKKPVKTESSLQAAALRAKMKELMLEAIKEAGNPRKGLSFRNLTKRIVNKCPTLRLDLDPKPLIHLINMEVYFRHVILVRGAGKCGCYRLPGAPDKEEEEEETKPEKNVKKGAKDVKKDGDEDDKEGKEDEEDNKEGDGKKAKQDTKKIPGKTTVKLLENIDRLREPLRVEDTFPMALTFMAEPKEAHYGKIKSYITRHFRTTKDSKFKEAMENGVDKGLWEQTTDRSKHVTYRLLVNDLNPSHQTSLDDRICLAILAVTEPKQASLRYMKEYINEYYPKFKISDRPALMKRAMERCIEGGLLRQMSGIGLTGSFQLGKSFTPSPALLAGEDEESSSEEESGSEDEASDNESEISAESYGSGATGEKYRIKPTRSGRNSGVIRSSITKFGKGKKPSTLRTSKTSQGRRR